LKERRILETRRIPCARTMNERGTVKGSGRKKGGKGKGKLSEAWTTDPDYFRHEMREEI
jgi:hypothetical protein